MQAVPNITLASGVPFVWRSSDNTVVSVDAMGNISGSDVGNAIVGVYTPDGTLLAECTVNVSGNNTDNPDNPETSIAFEKISTDTLKYGEKIVLHINTANLHEDASVKWTTSDGSVFKISNENAVCTNHSDCTTCTVESVGNGSAKIKATVVDKDGNPIVLNGEELSVSYTLNSKAGIFQKIMHSSKGFSDFLRHILR